MPARLVPATLAADQRQGLYCVVRNVVPIAADASITRALMTDDKR